MAVHPGPGAGIGSRRVHMTPYTFNSRANRIVKARAAAWLGHGLDRLLQIGAGLSLAGGATLVVTGHHQGISLAGAAVIALTSLTWVRRDLRSLPAAALGSSHRLDQLLP